MIFILSFLGSKAPSERTFSQMNFNWPAEFKKKKKKVEILQALLGGKGKVLLLLEGSVKTPRKRTSKI